MIDGETSQPLPGANVFLSNTTKGSSTDVNGSFHIRDLRPVRYQLVVSFVGYKTEMFDVLPDKPVTYKIILAPAPETLSEVVVRSKKMSRKEWLASLKMFKDHFIGFSDNAKYCDFVNPTVLDFDTTGALFNAFTGSALNIDNRGLGYRVKVFLQTYQYDRSTTQLTYVGPMNYELLSPEDDKEKIRWARNRLKAYYGSPMHFFRALYNKRLNEEGFYFMIPGKPAASDTTIKIDTRLFRQALYVTTIRDYKRILDLDSLDGDPVLKFKGVLEVQYVKETETKAYQDNRYKPIEKKPQLSWINITQPAAIEPNGQAWPIEALQYRGYWSWELMSETLPLDYEPNDDIALLKELDK